VCSGIVPKGTRATIAENYGRYSRIVFSGGDLDGRVGYVANTLLSRYVEAPNDKM
jgi:hypothetical protein